MWGEAPEIKKVSQVNQKQHMQGKKNKELISFFPTVGVQTSNLWTFSVHSVKKMGFLTFPGMVTPPPPWGKGSGGVSLCHSSHCFAVRFNSQSSCTGPALKLVKWWNESDERNYLGSRNQERVWEKTPTSLYRIFCCRKASEIKGNEQNIHSCDCCNLIGKTNVQ